MTPLFFRAYASGSFAGCEPQIIAERIRSEPERFLPENNPALTMQGALYYAASEGKGWSRFWSLIDPVVADALNKAGLSADEIARTGIFAGSSSVQLTIDEEVIAGGGELMLKYPYCAWVPQTIGDRLGFGGPKVSVSMACASSASAMIEAAHALNSGLCEVAVVIGYEVSNRLSQRGFEALGLLSSRGVEPFGLNRSGMVLGEGCGVLVLSKEPARWCFLGGAAGIDPYGVTAHDPGGERMAQLIKRAAQHSKVHAAETTLVKAHATGSENNDLAEGNALWRFFEGSLPAVSALKPYVGHTLGACGALETAVLLSCLEQGFAPGQPRQNEPDAATRCVAQGAHVPWHGGTVLSTYLGFGGAQTAIFIKDNL